MIIGKGPGALEGVARILAVFAIVLAVAAPALAQEAVLEAPPAPDARVFGDDENLNEGASVRANVEPPVQTPAEEPPKPAYLTEDQPLELRDYDEPRPAEPEPWWQQLLGFLIKLAIVLGLVVVSLVLLKKYNGGRLALPTTKGRNMAVLETTSLGPNQALHLVSVGGERLLVVGATPQGLSTLAEITDPHTVRLFLQGTRSGASAFNQVFDLESVVQEAGGDLFQEAMREQKRRKGWPGR